MKRKQVIILISVLTLVLVVVLIKTKISTNVNEIVNDQPLDLQTQYEAIEKTKKPSIIVFSYDGECCESTKQYFDTYNAKVERIFEDYKKHFETLFINTDSLTEEEKKYLMTILSENRFKRLPTFVIRNQNGVPYKAIEGSFDDIKVRELLDGMVE